MMKVLFYISFIIPLVLGYLAWGYKIHKTNITIGPFAFDLQIKQDDLSLMKIVDYINSPDNNNNSNNWALINLQNYYFIEASEKSLIDKINSFIFYIRNGESKKIYIRRLFSQIFAFKTGQISAAEREINANLSIKANYKDYIFLGQILSVKDPVDNTAILSCFQKALAFPACKKDKISYKRALANIHLRKGHIQVKKHNYEKAIPEYLEVIKINKYSYAAYSELGTCYWKIGDLGKAIDNYDNAIRYSNDMSHTITALFNKSNLIFQNTKSQRDNKKCDENEYHQELRKALVSIDLAIKHFEKTYSDYPIGSSKTNDLRDMLYVRAHIYHELDITEKSRMDLEKCLELSIDKTMRNRVEKLLKSSNKANSADAKSRAAD